jgi:hypothetical protein
LQHELPKLPDNHVSFRWPPPGNWNADYRRLRIAGRKLPRTEPPGDA